MRAFGDWRGRRGLRGMGRLGGRGGASPVIVSALRLSKTGVPNTMETGSVKLKPGDEENSLGVAATPPLSPSSPDTTGPTNKAGRSGQLGPATGLIGAMASGVGLAT